MCELAFNVNGERFVPPATAESWRVRRLRSGGRGMPEVVFDKEGTPLVIPMDTEVAEFRRLVGNEPGRYRLDPIDADGKPCDDAIPAYLQISGNGGASAPPEATSRSGDAHIDLIRDVVRTNSEMVKTIADKFALVMQSAADLIRAADGAGMPRREPNVAELRNAEGEEEDDDEDGDDEVPATGFVGLLQHLRPFAELVNNIMDTQGAARGGPPVAPRNGAPRNGVSGQHASAKAEAHEDEAPAGAAEPEARRPFNMMSHLSAIEALLSAEEMQVVRARVSKMNPVEMQEWSQRIAGLDPEQAAELIRAEVRGGKGGGQ